jgi:2-aminoadipate transaminase
VGHAPSLTQYSSVTQYQERSGILDLGWGHPAAWALPTEQWLAAGGATLRAYGAQALTYGRPAGPGPLIEWLAGHLSGTDRGGCRTSEIFVTAGASHALDLICTILTRPGDVVVVDSPTYHLALRVIADKAVSIVGAPADADGLDPAATGELIDALRRDGRRVAMLYLVPTFGNPISRNLPDDRRRALVEMAIRTGVTLVEDDTYRELVYEGTAPASLWSLAGGESVVRIGSFAKTVAPGLRLGWLNARRDLVQRLVGLGYVHSGGGVNHTNALTMADFGTSGAYGRHVGEIRARYALQRDALVAALRSALPGPVPSPSGGWFIWLALPAGLRGGALLPIAERLGVSYLDGPRFFAGTGGDGHIRLSFSMLAPPDLAEAARRLAATIRAAEDVRDMS